MTITKNNKAILIAEDEKPMAKALKLKFESEGFEVVSAYDGEDVMNLYKPDTFDAVILDIIMPKHDGFELLEFISKEDEAHPPIFILSNLSQEEDKEKALELGAVDFVIKSNTPIKEVVKRITDHL